MSFGNIVQETHYYRSAAIGNFPAGAAFTMQFTSPTAAGNAIIILVTPPFGGLGTNVNQLTLTNPDWTFTARSENILGTSAAPMGRLYDALNAASGDQPVTVTNAGASQMGSWFHVSMYEIHTPHGMQHYTRMAALYGEGMVGIYPTEHNVFEEDRRAFIICAMSYTTNSTGAGSGSGGTPHNPIDYSPVLGMPVQYSATPAATVSETTGMVDYYVFSRRFSRPVPTPTETHMFAGAFGATVESGGAAAQYVEGTDAVAAAATTGAAHFGGGGSYTLRAVTQDGTWTAAGTSRAFTKPTGTVSGDAVFLFLVWTGGTGSAAAWASGVPDSSFYTLPSGFSVLDEGNFGGWYTTAEDGWPPVWAPYTDTMASTEYPRDLYYVLAVKAAGASEPSTYTTTFTAGYAGWGACFTAIAMPASAQVLSANTAGSARGPQGTAVGGLTGQLYLGWGAHPGGRSEADLKMKFNGQKARSSDYLAIHFRLSGRAGGSGVSIDVVPDADKTIVDSSANDGYSLRVYNAGSDPYANLSVREYYSGTGWVSGGLEDVFLWEYSFAKMWVVGTPTTLVQEESLALVAPRVRVNELPYDLRNIRLGREDA